MLVDEKSIQFDLSQLEEVAKKFPNAVDRALDLTGQELTRQMKLEAPVDEGFLKGSIDLPVKVRDLVYEIHIGAAYWRPVQLGITKAYDIFPINAKALAFEWRGEFVFFKKVTIPPRPGNPFIDRAIETTEKRIPEFVQIALDRVGTS